MDFINQMEPSFDSKEADHLYSYMQSGGWVTEFKKTREFEELIREYTGAKYCWVVANGTVSLSIALMACGVGVGDEVICPDYTMVATPNSAELIGAKAVFVDIDRGNLCMDFAQMKEAITPKTKAVMLVSINGRYPENIEEFASYCKEKGIHLIEDAAQSLGSFYKGTHLGRFGEIGSFSFSAPKIITTGQGGALITDDDELNDKIKKIRDFGRDKGGSDHYLVKGWNFKFTDIQGIVGIEQMKKLPQRVERKKEMGRLYESLLQNIDGVELVPTNYDNTAPWFYDILCEKREELVEFLKSKNVGARVFYPPLHAEPAYGYNELHFPVTEEISAKGLWLPSSINLTNQQIEYICGCVREFYSK
ncbi:MAG: DegT/DnrJ/EryC1/StrS family aminotransferase [Oscillospiraceae bacterium]